MHKNSSFSFFFYIEKYDIIGRLLKPGDKPSIYPAEDSAVDGTDSSELKKDE